MFIVKSINKIILPIFIGVVGVLVLFVALFASASTNALSGSQFQADRIIDDSVFYNKTTMSAGEIQSFLNSKVPTCDTNGAQWHPATNRTRAAHGAANGNPAPYTCLKDYRENVPSIANSGSDLCKGSITAGSKTAAQILYDVAQACGINPQVLIVTLQKEQSLITDDWPWTTQYQKAMGYYCPDDPSRPGWCHPDYAGFFRQVYNAAEAFQRYAANPANYNYRAGRNNTILYNPNTSCGSSNVFIQNQATASLYIYTPYQPNQAALNNLYGSGDSCSAYGNRNFWRLFNDWFGSTLSNDTTAAHPSGTLVSDGSKIYRVGDGVRHHVGKASVFESYGYQWNEVKPATIGDKNLPDSWSLQDLREGTLFRAQNSSVYVAVIEGGKTVKQLVTYSAFNALGYNWDSILVIPERDFPTDNSAVSISTLRHPNGTLIDHDGNVYILDHNTRRSVNQYVFSSHSWNWGDVVKATAQDKTLTRGANMLLRDGSVLYDGTDLYITKVPALGSEIKQPITPWSCFADKFRYSLSEAVRIPRTALPANTGAVIRC